MTEDWRNGGFGIYVHWPFCEAKCPYCDFNSHVARFIDHDAWRQAYLKEIDRYADELPDRIVNSVFFGGGTPSLMDPETVEAVLTRISQKWRLANDVEITLEANPSSVEADRFAAYRDAGVNRTSLGIQALNDRDLQRLGRLHSVDEALRALDTARSLFDRVSFDLIYARQDQSAADWEAELSRALKLGTTHLSLYQLTIEDGTAFGDRYKRGRLTGLPSDDLSADLYEMTAEMCAGHGLARYETSNYARPGDESRHNLIYWRYGDYVGIGPGAHGRVTPAGHGRTATETVLQPGAWLKGIGQGAQFETRETLTAEDQASEFLLMGLRLQEGVNTIRFQGISRNSISPENLDHLLSIGAVEVEGATLRVSESHAPVLNAVIEQLLRP